MTNANSHNTPFFSPNYLGDLRVVDSLVRDLLKSVLDAKSPEEGIALIEEMIAIFSASVSGYAAVPGWNTTDELGEYIRRHSKTPIHGTNLREILGELFLGAVRQIKSIAAASSSLSNEEIDNNVEKLVNELVAVLTQTWEITFPASKKLFDYQFSALPPSAE